MKINVGILAIGNEVVEGQITNRNASWLSEQLGYIGAHPLFHLSCRDNHDEITQSLNFLESHCQLILVSGGLGPTKDDFTRQSLSQWLDVSLAVDEKQWQVIQDKLNQRKLTIRDGHKNQALIPEGAQPLPNSKGVAPGFFIKSRNCYLAALPGPPYELHAMFTDELKPLIEKELAPKKENKLNTFICLGAPESELAHITESIVGNEFELGYRIHKPYVEIKVWTPLELNADQEKKISLLKEKISTWHVGDSIQGIRGNFHQFLKKYNHVFVIDHLTSGLFLEKLKENFVSDHLRYQCFEHKSFRHFTKEEVQGILSHMNVDSMPDSLFISLFAQSDRSAYISFNNEIRTVNLPRSITITSKLGQLYTLENAFLWNRNG